MQESLAGKTVVVTGASRGIGRATAIELARCGARVALLGRDAAALDNAAQACRSQGPAAQSYSFDLRDEQALMQAARAISEELGTPQALVNNAAVGKYGTFMDLSLDDWRQMLDVNVLGLVAATRAFLPGMLASRSGCILNIASIQGLRTSPSSSAYSATKFAVVGLTQSLGQELRPKGIRVAVLCPGGVETGFGGSDPRNKLDWLAPEDVAVAARQMLETGGRAWATQTILLPFLDG